MSRSELTVVIVGAGFSGTMVAWHLAMSGRPVRIALIDPAGFGPGVAYGAGAYDSLLNVPALGMSALPDDPRHFIRWLHGRGILAAEQSFVPRRLYGEYVRDLLEQAGRCAPIELIADRAIDVHRVGERARVVLEQSGSVFGDRVVLATGNFPPRALALDGLASLEEGRYISNPWAPGAMDTIGADEPVLFVGTGLTMADAAVHLRRRGHTAPLHAISRRGLVPRAHQPARISDALPAPREVLNAPRTARSLLRGLRCAVRRAAAEGYDWRDVIGALRPYTANLWSTLPRGEKARFLATLRPYWDIHRHRLPPELATELRLMWNNQHLQILRGRLLEIRPDGSALRVSYRPRGTDAVKNLRVARIVNCTGPESDVRRLPDAIWRNLLQRELIVPDEFGLGLLTSASGALLDRASRPFEWLYLVGPLRKAQYWEATAVPELRVQVRQTARQVRGGRIRSGVRGRAWRRSRLRAALDGHGSGI